MRLHYRVNDQEVPQQQRTSAVAGGTRQILWRGWLMMVIFLAATAGAIQTQPKTPAKGPQSQTRRPQTGAAKKTAPAKPQADSDLNWLLEAAKDPELVAAVSHLQQRMAKDLTYPAPRTQSRILSRLPESTVFYAALPNLGPVVHQGLGIFQEELRDSAALRNFLHKNKLDDAEPKFEDGLQKFYEFAEYLGDEFVITGGLKGQEPSGALIAEIKKPGLKTFLEKIDLDLNAKSSQHLRIVDPQQLSTATDDPAQGPVVLVRPDFMVVSLTAAAVRDVNAQLDKGGSSFTSIPLGKRLVQAYQSGTSSVFGANLQNLMALLPQNPAQARMVLEKTGFGDVKYAVMENKLSGGHSINQMELVFNGPRRGVASWIAAPAPLGGLDFLSPKAAVAEAFRLKNPAQILDDLVEIVGPQAFQMLPQMEAQFNVNLKQDVLSKLGGEIAFELQPPTVPTTEQTSAEHAMVKGGDFKVVLSVTDAAALQQTLKRLLVAAPFQSGERTEDGVTFYTLSSPSAPDAGPAPEFNYFFMDGYLVVTSSRAEAQEAVRLHRSGGSLGRSNLVTAAASQPAKASILVYQNSGTFLAAMAKQAPPELTALLTKLMGGDGAPKPNVFLGYADENSLRGTTNNNVSTDATLGLIVATVAIPNLLHSRMAANEAAATSSLRMVNVAEVTYRTSYPNKGYAATLAALGPGTGDCSATVTAAHACLLDDKLGNASCTAGKWCEKNGYRYNVRGICGPKGCTSYVVTATPVSANTGTKSLCTTTDAVIRQHMGPPLTAPLTAAECRAWKPL